MAKCLNFSEIEAEGTWKYDRGSIPRQVGKTPT